MKISILATMITGLMCTAGAFADVELATWPSWRGADGTGVVADGNPPLQWSETENVKWKTALPGEGQSTPIIWGDKIFLQTAVPVGADDGEIRSAFGGGAPPSKKIAVPYQFVVLCIDRSSGDILWQTEVCQTLPHEGHHPTGSLAPYTPVTDGNHVWASFGSRGLYCLDIQGNIVWQQESDELRMAGRFGEGSSPLLVDEKVIVLADHEGQSRITAFNKQDGTIAWKHDRDEISSWSTPIATVVNGRTEVITAASNAIRSYDVESGDLIWECSGLTNCAAASPVVADGKVYCSTGFRGVSTMAIELGHEGNLTDSDAVSWTTRSVGTNVPSPLVYKNRLYILRGYSNALTSFDATTGEEIFSRERLEGQREIYASPIAVNGYLYFAGRNGTTSIVEASDTFTIVATNTLDEALDGSPVVVDHELYLRGRSHLYCIADSDNRPSEQGDD
jgi:outer membrane protein assembly factor BamB